MLDKTIYNSFEQELIDNGYKFFEADTLAYLAVLKRDLEAAL